MSEAVKLLQVETFLKVAETGSFRRGAIRLSVGQSVVSRRIQALEDHLGVSLFERRPSGARLTPAGVSFASRARVLLCGLDNAVEAARSAGIADAGQLNVGIIVSLSQGPLRNVLRAFLQEHRDVDVHVRESERSELLTLLSHRRMDVVVAAGEPPTENGDGFVLMHEEIFLAVRSDKDWARCTRLHWEDVRDATFIVSDREPGPEIHEYLIRRISDLGRTVRVRRHGLGREGIMALVGLGLGVSLVADHWRGVRYPNVSFVRVGDEDERVPFSLIWRPENDNPALRRFISLARIEAKRNGALS